MLSTNGSASAGIVTVPVSSTDGAVVVKLNCPVSPRLARVIRLESGGPAPVVEASLGERNEHPVSVAIRVVDCGNPTTDSPSFRAEEMLPLRTTLVVA